MQALATELIPIPKRKLRSIINDPQKTAAAVNLVYVTDSQEGIRRIKNGKGFSYVMGNNKLKDKDHLKRIKSLVIPPAWENVWICVLENGHLQVTGTDVKKRKQYKYHSLWNTLRNQTKFYRLLDFGKAIPAIRLRLEKDLSLPGLPMPKVLATIVSLMERTNIRIGNNSYEKLYGSYGLTTLKDDHVEIKGSNLKFSFKGKKGIEHKISIRNKKLSALVKRCRDIPGRELFQYYDENGERRSVDSGMVNEYIKEVSGQDFTAKDFRTWAGTVQAVLAFRELGDFDTQAAGKKKVVEALDKVSEQLGNTRNVCRKYYVHPAVINLYESRSLDRYLKELDKIEVDDDKTGLTAEEKIVMKILSNN